MTTISLVVVVFLTWHVLARTKALLGFESDCPVCLNGGLCLPAHRVGRVAEARVLHGHRCFCPSGWIGDACEIPIQDELPLDSHGTLAATSKDDVGAPKYEVKPPDVLVWSLLAPADGSEDLQNMDEMTLRYAVYSTICQESPCPYDLVMEDIILLPRSSSEMRFGILLPADEGSSLGLEVEDILKEEMQNVHSSLREALENHFAQYSFELVRGQGDITHLFQGDLSAAVGGHRSIIGNTSAQGSHLGTNRLPPPDEIRTSYASKCITAMVVLKLWAIGANIFMERLSRWCKSTGDPDDPENQFDRDFDMCHGLCEVLKHPVFPFANFAVLLFLVQLRARALTEGLGDPPQWVEHFMVGSVVCHILVGSCMFFRFVFKRTKIGIHGAGAIERLFNKPRRRWAIPLFLATVGQTTCVIAVVYGYYTMTPEDCPARSTGIDATTWKNYPAPERSFEENICMWLFLQTLLAIKIEQVVITMSLYRMYFARDDEQLKQNLRDGLGRCKFLIKSSSFTPVVSVLIIAVWHVPPETSEDKAFREMCLYLLYGFLLTYRILSFVVMALPRNMRIDVESIESVVSFTSSADYMVNRLGDAKDVMYRNVRRSLLVVVYSLSAALGLSVFFLDDDGRGPSETLTAPVMWTIILTLQSIFVSFLLLAHETIIEPILRRPAKEGDDQQLLNSVIRETDCFVQLIPCLAVLCLVAQHRVSNRMGGQLPEWAITSMNVIAQMMLLQLVIILLEAILGYRGNNAVNDGATLRDPFLETPPVVGETGVEHAKGPLRSSSTKEFGDTGYKPFEEAVILGRAVGSMFCTCAQLVFMWHLYIATTILVIAVWTLRGSSHRTHRETALWVFPVGAEASPAVYVIAQAVFLFFFVKTMSHFMTAVRRIYQKLSWFAISSIHKTDDFVDIIPWVMLLCLLVQGRAATLHGIHASPPYFVIAHMYAIPVALLVDLFCNVLAITFTSTSKTGLISDLARYACLFCEAFANIVLHWSVFVLLVSIPIMRPEDVVLHDGSNGVPWAGPGKPPELEYLVWNLLVLCVLVFLVTLLHKIAHTSLAHQRLSKGKDRKSQVRLWLALQHGQMARLFQAGSLARKAILDDSLQLGILFFPLASLKHPMMGEVRHHKHEHMDRLIPFMHMLFFVITVTLAMKTFFVFCFGYIDTPQKQEIMQQTPRSKSSESTLVFEKPRSAPWASEDSHVFPIVQVFKRMAVTVGMCECVLLLALCVLLMVALHTNGYSVAVLGTEELFAASFLFLLYMGTEYAWECVVLMGYVAGRLDALLEVVQCIPVVLLLFVATRMRTLEVGGKYAEIPPWVAWMQVAVALILAIDWGLVFAAPSQITPTRTSDTEEQMPKVRSDAQASNDKTRIFYLAFRFFLRVCFHSVICAILFALFWITEEMCPLRQ